MKLKLKELLNLYDNWNTKLRINDEEEAKPIVEYDYVYEFAFEGEAKEYEYLKEYYIMSFGFYDETLCVRVAKPTSLGIEIKLSDLRVGDIVRFRQGGIAIVFINSRSKNNLGLFTNLGCFMYLDNFQEDLTYFQKGKWDIVSVCKISDATIKREYIIYDILEKFMKGTLTKNNIEAIPWDWNRKETKQN